MKKNSTGVALSRSQMKKVTGGVLPPDRSRYRCDCGGGTGIVYMCTSYPLGGECVPTCCTYISVCSSSFDNCWS